MSSTLHNARIELRARDITPMADDLIDALTGYSPAIGLSERGWVEVIISVPATDLRQAFTTATALVAQATPLEQLVVEVMTTDEFDARLGLDPVPELVSVTEAADILGVTRQAVLQRLDAGTLPGRRVGNAWVVQRAALANAQGRPSIKVAERREGRLSIKAAERRAGKPSA